MGHRDLWEQILWERGRAGDDVQIRWVPSHSWVAGNQGADRLVEEGAEVQPNNAGSASNAH